MSCIVYRNIFWQHPLNVYMQFLKVHVVKVCQHLCPQGITRTHYKSRDYIIKQFTRVTDCMYTWAVKMSEQGSVVKRRSVLNNCGKVDCWNNKTLITTVWLKYNMNPVDCTRVISLKCSISSCFKDRLIGRRNYSVDGSGNLRVSSSKDHAASGMYSHAMLLLKKQV